MNVTVAPHGRSFTATLGKHRILLQSAVALLVGTLLGVYLTSASTLPEKYLYLAVLLVIMPFLIMIIGSLRQFLLAVILIEIPFQLDINLFFDEQVAQSGALPGLNISVTTVALLVLYGQWFAELMCSKRTLPRGLGRLCLPLLTYLTCVIFSLIVARNVDLAFYEIALLVQSFFLFVYIVGTVHSQKDVLLIVSLLLVGLVLQSLVMIGLRIVGHSFSVGTIDARIDGNTRVGGTVGSPISAASYLGLLLAPALSILLTQLKFRTKLLATLGLGLGGIALIFTLSRGGWIATTVSAGILCLLAWRQGWMSLKVIITIFLVVAGLGLSYQGVISTRIFGDDRGSAEARPILMQLAWRMIADYPWRGVGSNNFSVELKNYITPEFRNEWLYTVHNKYLLIWAETGIVALSAFLWFLSATLLHAWRCWQLRDRTLSPIALAIAAAIFGHMIHMLVDVFHSRPQVQMLWLSAAVITAIYSTYAQQLTESSPESSGRTEHSYRTLSAPGPMPKEA